jgi:hypothetical protein
MRAYCFVLSQEVVQAFPLRVSWFLKQDSILARAEVQIQMGRFRAIADGCITPDEVDLRAIAQLMKHFTPDPEAVLGEELYIRFFL